MLYRQKVKLAVRLNMNSVIVTFFNNEMISSIDRLFKTDIVLSILFFLIFSSFYFAVKWNYDSLELNKLITCKTNSFLLCWEPDLISDLIL